MKRYTIDLDLYRLVFACQRTHILHWRLSSSGKGLHITWHCHKAKCKRCEKVRRSLDDCKRHKLDALRLKNGTRSRQASQVLFSNKGGRKAGKWHIVTK